MQTTQNAVSHNEYRSIPVTALVESASNPRKRFDETSLNELADCQIFTRRLRNKSAR
jgi:hypothetical protein